MNGRLLIAALGAAVIVAAGPGPARAQDDRLQEGLGLLSQGGMLLLQGLKDHLDPALAGLQGWLSNIDNYELPEVLPNGDIIIRRKKQGGPAPSPDAPDPLPPSLPPPGMTDL